MNAEPTCQLSTQFFKTAQKKSTGIPQIDLSGMQTIVMVLKSSPSLSTRDLRPMLTQYIPSEQELDAKFLRNFRLRVAYFLAKNPNYNDLTYEQTNGLLSKKYVTEEEHKVLDNPITRISFRDIYQNPSYYAGYYLRNIDGNIWLLGSVSAEQNHSSIISYIGDGGNWSIMLHMSKLMSRHQDYVKKRKQKKICYMLDLINII